MGRGRRRSTARRPGRANATAGRTDRSFEQVAAQAAGKDLLSCSPDEIAGVTGLAAVLPPQYVQAALSPDALTVVGGAHAGEHGYNSQDLVAGIGTVREAMREQMRASGMLGTGLRDPDPSLYKTDAAE